MDNDNRVLAGRFTLEDLAGRGAMGSVFRANDSPTGRRVALKLLHAVTSQRGGPPLQPGGPAARQVLVDRMLAKDPKRRLSDADALLEARSALESVPELCAIPFSPSCSGRWRCPMATRSSWRSSSAGYQVPENARTLELTRQRWGGAEV